MESLLWPDRDWTYAVVSQAELYVHRSDLLAVLAHLPGNYRVLLSDVAGNKERLAFYYDAEAVRLLDKIGEIAIPPASQFPLPLFDPRRDAVADLLVDVTPIFVGALQDRLRNAGLQVTDHV